MKKGKKVTIFLLINIIILTFAVVIPSIPAYKIYKTFDFEVPSNVTVENKVSGTHTSKLMEDLIVVMKDLQTEDGKEHFKSYERIMTECINILYMNGKYMYIIFGITIGIIAIVAGIVLKYKSLKIVYPSAFIVSGMIVIIYYISVIVLWQINYRFNFWS